MDARNSTLDPFVELYGPNGNLIGQDDDSGEGLNSLLRTTLSQNGRHKIIARGYSPVTSGGYRLSLNREAVADPDDGRWIALGQSLQGTISPNNDRDWYYFSATVGRTIVVRMNKIDSGLDSYLELYNPGGIKVAENDDGGGDRNSLLVYTVPSGGVYRLLARSWNLASSGRYNLRMQSAANNNLAQGGGAWATTTQFPGVEPHRAVDGDLTSRWSSAFSDPQFIYVDLGRIRTFDEVVLRWERAYARSYGLYYWTGTEWRNVFWTSRGDGGIDTIRFSPVQARYVGMFGTQRGTSWGYSLWEFEVYDSSAALIPLVPPDPGDKGAETDVTPLVPLPPNELDKPVILVGDGEYAQENTPLAEDVSDIAPTTGVSTTIPTAHLLYPMPDQAVFYPQDVILFQGLATDNDEGGESITEYEWRSSIDGMLSNQPLFTMTAASLTPGLHTISFRARDDEGDWSQTQQMTIKVMDAYRVYLPTLRK
jgi:hypothetical protein